MTDPREPQGERGRMHPALPLVLVLIPLIASLFSGIFAHGEGKSAPFLERPGPEHESCVRPTEVMRYHHMDVLKEIRDDAVRDGRRTDLNFERCASCHTSRAKFCDRCHEAVNLTPDCFGCHDYPE